MSTAIRIDTSIETATDVSGVIADSLTSTFGDAPLIVMTETVWHIVRDMLTPAQRLALSDCGQPVSVFGPITLTA